MAESPVGRAFATIERAGFLRPESRGDAAYDGPIPIGHGQTNSQPRTVRDMLELLMVETGQSILDVGAGSGWTTALLAHLVGPRGRVVGVELEPELAEWGAANLGRCAMPWGSIRLAEPDVLGVPEDGPYDRILVSATARSMPVALISQLVVGGRMVVPIGTMMTCVRRTGASADDIEVTIHGAYSFVPLR